MGIPGDEAVMLRTIRIPGSDNITMGIPGNKAVMLHTGRIPGSDNATHPRGNVSSYPSQGFLTERIPCNESLLGIPFSSSEGLQRPEGRQKKSLQVPRRYARRGYPGIA